MIYRDANLYSIFGGTTQIIEFIGANDEVLTVFNNSGEVHVIYDDIDKTYGYHFVGKSKKHFIHNFK